MPRGRVKGWDEAEGGGIVPLDDAPDVFDAIHLEGQRTLPRRGEGELELRPGGRGPQVAGLRRV